MLSFTIPFYKLQQKKYFIEAEKTYMKHNFYLRFIALTILFITQCFSLGIIQQANDDLTAAFTKNRSSPFILIHAQTIYGTFAREEEIIDRLAVEVEQKIMVQGMASSRIIFKKSKNFCTF